MQETASSLENICIKYTPDEEACLLDAVRACFGEISTILREVASPEISPDSRGELWVDLCVCPPTQARPYYTVVTCGMGAQPMPVPHDMQEFDRAELVFMLPEDWNINGRDESSCWPLHWLRLLARLPREEESWLGWGHTIPNGEPFAENTRLSSILLLDAHVPEGEQSAGEDAGVFLLSGGQPVRFYQCFALYDEELDDLLEYGVQALLERFSAAGMLSPVLDSAREHLFLREKTEQIGRASCRERV